MFFASGCGDGAGTVGPNGMVELRILAQKSVRNREERARIGWVTNVFSWLSGSEED